jgi:CDP-glycerol glycerophosphotransferase
VVINLYHGVPWKKIGYNNSVICKGLIVFDRLFRKIDYVLATSEYDKSEMMSAFAVKNTQVIEAGYPRNMGFYRKDFIDECRTEVKEHYDLSYSTTIITYLPTFRDGEKKTFSFNNVTSKEFDEWLKVNNVVIIEKGHYISQERNSVYNKDHARVITNPKIETQRLLAATDILVTDYSSCFFDYLILNRPIIHFLYDYEYYRDKDRGLIRDKEDVVCGDVAYDWEGLFTTIKENYGNYDRNRSLRKQRISEYMQYSSREDCKVIYEEVQRIVINNIDNNI